jgi:hypothetical protein
MINIYGIDGIFNPFRVGVIGLVSSTQGKALG